MAKPAKTARSTAVYVLSAVLASGKSLTAALALHLPKLDQTQQALAQALCYGVLRNYHFLDYSRQSLLDKPLKRKDLDIKILLLLGIFQLRYTDTKPYAAVNETVRTTTKIWAKPLINAVLRQFIRRQNEISRSAQNTDWIFYSHPKWLADKIAADWQGQALSILQQNNNQAPMWLRVNLAKISRDDYLAMLQGQGIAATIGTFGDAAVLLDRPVPVAQLPQFAAGAVSVQDASAQLASDLLEAQPRQQVLDLCAAPGGKTAALLEKCPTIKCNAIDIDGNRLALVRQNLQRLQLSATLRCCDALQLSCTPLFDRILLDAPCSASGVIRRHPDIKLLRRPSDIDNLSTIQSKMLATAWQQLKSGGILLYATCSIFKQENEIQIANFLATHPDAQEIIINADWGHQATFGRQILAGELGWDGFYYAKLRKI